jgi:hypothetical protein
MTREELSRAQTGCGVGHFRQGEPHPELPHLWFWRYYRRRDGREYWVTAEHMEKLKESQRRRVREASRRYALANPEKVAEAKRKYAKANPEKSAEWAKANPELVMESKRRWNAANPEKRNAHHAVSHAIRDEN